MATPKKNKDWSKNFETIWNEALSIFEEFSDNDDKQRLLYRMAPTLVCHEYEIDDPSERKKLVTETLTWVEASAKNRPDTPHSVKYNFALAYLQTHVQAKLISPAKAKDLINYFAAKGVVISELH